MKKNKSLIILLLMVIILGACTNSNASTIAEGDLQLGIIESSIEKPMESARKLINKIEILSNNIYQGISINSIDVGGLSIDQAEEKLASQSNQAINSKVINLVHGDRSKEIRLKDLNLIFDYEEALDAAYKYGRQGSNEERLDNINKAMSQGVNLSSNLLEESQDLIDLYDSLNEEFGIKKENPSYSYKDGQVIALDGKDGKIIDKDDFLEKLVNSIGDSKISKINLVLVDDLAADKAEIDELNSNLGNIGSSSTNYNTGDKSRSHNVWLSADRINNKVIAPGQTFSFMDNFGKLNSSNSYQEGSTIVNGEFVSGIGGGVCQVSTTGYQAAIRAGLKIVERNPHSRPVSYTSKGSDAMVSSSWSDLKVRNDYDFPIVIKANASGGTLNISFLGDTSKKNYKITYSTETIEEIPRPVEKRINKDLEPGSELVVQEGNKGYKAVMYITNHGTGETYLNHTDHYRARPQIIEYNPEIIELEPTPEPEEEVDLEDEPEEVEDQEENSQEEEIINQEGSNQ